MTKKTLTLKCGFERAGTPRNGEIRLRLLTGASEGGWRPGKPAVEPYPMMEIVADFAAGHVPIKFDGKAPADSGKAGSIVAISRDSSGFWAQVSWTPRARALIDARRMEGKEPSFLFEKSGDACAVTLITSVEFFS